MGGLIVNVAGGEVVGKRPGELNGFSVTVIDATPGVANRLCGTLATSLAVSWLSSVNGVAMPFSVQVTAS